MITPEQLLAELRTIAEKAMANAGGVDHVYTQYWGIRSGAGCRYVHLDEEGKLISGCIIGHWAHDRGVSLPQLHLHEGASAGQLLAYVGLDGRTAVQLTPVQRIATQVQRYQDRGLGWLESVEKVERVYAAGGFRAAANERNEEIVMDLFGSV